MIARADLVGLGASEVPAAAGYSPWTTPVGLWMRKVGLDAPATTTAPMRTGTALERALVRLLADQEGVTLRHNSVTFPHPDYPAVPLYATPDGFGPHRSSLVEVKVVGHRGADWSAGPPPYVRLQALAQLACIPRAGQVIVGALIGSEVKAWRVERDPEAISVLVDGAVDWWRQYVQAEVAPPATTEADTWALVRARLAAHDGARLDRVATDTEEVIAAELAALVAHQDALATEIEERRRTLALAAEGGDITGATWRGRWSERRTVDWPALAAEAGITERLVDRYTRHTPTFTFRRTKEAP